MAVCIAVWRHAYDEVCNFQANDIMHEEWKFVDIIGEVSVQLSVNLMKFILMRTQCVVKLVMITNGLLSLSDVQFTRSDVHGASTFMCTHWVCFYDFNHFLFFIFCTSWCTITILFVILETRVECFTILRWVTPRAWHWHWHYHCYCYDCYNNYFFCSRYYRSRGLKTKKT